MDKNPQARDVLMAKARRACDPWKSRLFKTSSQSDLTELHDRGFDKEVQMHKLVERNIGTLFPGLKLLETEFREMARGELRPDTIAFDTTLDTFVALEYKNRLNKEAIDQARAYLSSMRQHRGELVLSHSNNMGCSPRDPKSFKWKKMYAIIMAPEFGGYQVFGADEDPNVELHEISMYDGRIMLVERVGGAHERTQAATRRNGLASGAGNQAAAPRLNGADGDIGLPDIEHVSGMVHPTELARPDGSRANLKSWRGMLAGVADWLVRNGHLDESHCPVPIGEKNAILNTRPAHQDGARSRHFVEAGHLHVFVNVNGANAIRYSIRLIETAGLNPSDFKAYFGDSARPARPITPPSSARVTVTRGSSTAGCEETNKCYDPHTATVAVGGKVIWTNDDLATHTVTSGVPDGGPDGAFDSGIFMPGAEFSHVFEEAGEHPYFDLLHPWMKGVVVVKYAHDPA